MHSPGRYLFKETSFSCQTADYDEAAGTGYKRTCDKTALDPNCPEQQPIYHANGTLAGYTTVAYISVEDDWPAEECQNFDEYNAIWRGHHVQDGGLRRGRGNRRHQDFPGAYVRVQALYDPVAMEFGYTSNGTAPVLGWSTSLCARTSARTR